MNKYLTKRKGEKVTQESGQEMYNVIISVINYFWRSFRFGKKRIFV